MTKLCRGVLPKSTCLVQKLKAVLGRLSAVVTLSPGWAAFDCHGLARFGAAFGCRYGVVRLGGFWLSRSRPLGRLLAVVTVLSAWAAFGCHGLARLGDFWLSLRCCPLGRLLAVTVLSAWAAFGSHGSVRLGGFWQSRSRPLVRLLAVVTVPSAWAAFGYHGVVRQELEFCAVQFFGLGSRGAPSLGDVYRASKRGSCSLLESGCLASVPNQGAELCPGAVLTNLFDIQHFSLLRFRFDSHRHVIIKRAWKIPWA